MIGRKVELSSFWASGRSRYTYIVLNGYCIVMESRFIFILIFSISFFSLLVISVFEESLSQANIQPPRMPNTKVRGTTHSVTSQGPFTRLSYRPASSRTRFLEFIFQLSCVWR
jgi:hypothetical protein